MKPKKYSSFLLPTIFLLGLVVALLCEFYKLHLIFGLSLVFTNIVLLLMVRWHGVFYGLSAAVLVYGASIFVWDSPYIQAVFLLELIVVALSMRKSKGDRLLLADALFWLFAGLPILLLLYSTTLHFQSTELWLMVTIPAANGLFNTLFAEMLCKHLPKPLSKNAIPFRRRPLYFRQVIFHIIIGSILIPSMFFIVSNSLNTRHTLSNYSLRLAESTAGHLVDDLRSWDGELWDQLSASDPNPETIEALKQFVVSHGTNGDLSQIIVSDSKGQIVAASRALTDTTNEVNEIIYHMKSPIFLHVPKSTSRILSVQNWHEALYIYNTEAAYAPLQITVIIPLNPYLEHIYEQYMAHFLFMVVSFICAAVIGLIVKRRLMRNLTQIAVMTTNLPAKLLLNRTTVWPKSRVYEFRLLIRNFREMSNKLVHMLHDSQQSNLLLQDQTAQLQKSEQKLHHLAYYDELTGLPNRLHFREYIKTLNLSNSEESPPFAVMFADLNRFKQINDTLGHSAGDHLLCLIAARFKKIATEQCKVFRISGDEFVFVLHYENIADVQQTAQAICDNLDEPFELNGRSLYMSVSIGISVYPFDGSDIDQIMRNADIAMYVAKEQGGGTYHFYDNLIEQQRAENMQLESDLKNALHSEQFTLYYQPQIDAESGEVIGAEALIRWIHPEFGIVSPAKFIPLAENSGIILDIDEWALREACRQNKSWQEAGLGHFPVAVNISARHFYQIDLIPMISKVLDETGLDPKYLIIEITEGTLIRNVEYGVQIMEELRKMGIHISMDDFGTGYSSLSQLDRLPITEMKLDRSFIQGLATDSRKSSIVKAVIELGHHMNLRIVAEGVESSDELDFLKGLNCDQFQGYYFSKPLPVGDFSSFIRSWDGAYERK